MSRVLGTIDYEGKSERFTNLWWQYPDGKGDLFVELADGRLLEFDGATIKPTDRPGIETITLSMNFAGLARSNGGAPETPPQGRCGSYEDGYGGS